MVERETRKRKENKERQPKKKMLENVYKVCTGKRDWHPPSPPPSGRSTLPPLKWILLVGLHPWLKKKENLLKFILPKPSHSDDVFLSLARLSGVWLFAFRFISFTPNCHHLTTYNTASQCTQVRVKKADTIIHKHGYFNPFCWCFKTTTSSDHL